MCPGEYTDSYNPPGCCRVRKTSGFAGGLFECSQYVTADSIHAANTMTCAYCPDPFTYLTLENTVLIFAFIWPVDFLSEKTLITEVVAQNLGMFISSEVINGQFIAGLVWEPAINTGTKVRFRWLLWFSSVCTDNHNTKPPVSEHHVVTSSLFAKGHCPSSVSSTNQLVA